MLPEFQESIAGATETIVTAVGASLVAIFLTWATVVFYYHRSKWRTLDIVVFLLLLEAIANQCSTLLYCCLNLWYPTQTTWCPGVAWLQAVTFTLQEGTLTTFAISTFLRSRMKTGSYRRTFSKSHLSYHFACLLLLSSCVGVAAILASGSKDSCQPYYDKRYLVFFLLLHFGLMCSAVFSLVYSCSCGRDINSRDNIKTRSNVLTSSSDLSVLSDLSILSTKSRNGGRICHSVSNCSSNYRPLVDRLLDSRSNGSNNVFTNGSSKFLTRDLRKLSSPREEEDCKNATKRCDLDSYSYSPSCDYRMDFPIGYVASTSASSTNSRSPCLPHQPVHDICLGTISAIITMVYVVQHIPVMSCMIISVVCPHVLPSNWPQRLFPLWCALAEGCLLPIVLFIFDERFAPRVASIYQTTSDKELYGKFRPYSGTLVETQNISNAENIIRFPITNGSLFSNAANPSSRNNHYGRTRVIRKNSSTPCSPPRLPWYLASEESTKVNSYLAKQKMQIDNNKWSECSQRYHQRKHCSCVHCTYEDCVLKPEDTVDADNAKQQQTTSKMILESLQYDSEDFSYDSCCEEPIYASLSAKSNYSVTTAANDDFEFFHHEKAYPTKARPEKAYIEKTYAAVGVDNKLQDSAPERCLNEVSRKILKNKESNLRSPCDITKKLRPNVRDYSEASPSKKRKFRNSPHPLNRWPTPPPPKKHLTSMLSVDCLVSAMSKADHSILDTGDLRRHFDSKVITASVPDLKKIFITEYL